MANAGEIIGAYRGSQDLDVLSQAERYAGFKLKDTEVAMLSQFGAAGVYVPSLDQSFVDLHLAAGAYGSIKDVVAVLIHERMYHEGKVESIARKYVQIPNGVKCNVDDETITQLLTWKFMQKYFNVGGNPLGSYQELLDNDVLVQNLFSSSFEELIKSIFRTDGVPSNEIGTNMWIPNNLTWTMVKMQSGDNLNQLTTSELKKFANRSWAMTRNSMPRHVTDGAEHDPEADPSISMPESTWNSICSRATFDLLNDQNQLNTVFNRLHTLSDGALDTDGKFESLNDLIEQLHANGYEHLILSEGANRAELEAQYNAYLLVRKDANKDKPDPFGDYIKTTNFKINLTPEPRLA